MVGLIDVLTAKRLVPKIAMGDFTKHRASYRMNHGVLGS